jgi:FMN phosphatase YigB (HAD superfamily)
MKFSPTKTVNPKSEKFNKKEFLRKLESIDANSHEMVSFDFFDTLVFRNSNTHYAGWREVSFGFYFNRIIAEVLARVMAKLCGRPEVRSKDIYRFMLSRWNPQIEIEYETKNLRPNAFLRQICNELVSRGITVVVISDTHFDKITLSSWLKNFGFLITDVYTSEEFLLTKSTGLFELIRDFRELEYRKWLHVGDNPHSDVFAAKKLGIETFFYPKLVDQLQGLQLFSGRGARKLLNSSESTFGVSTHLRELMCNANPPNWKEEDLPLWHVGFLVAASVSRSICEKIHSDHLRGQFDLILYSSRDGYLPFVSHALTYPHDPIKYFLTSRQISLSEYFPRYVEQIIEDLGWRGSTLSSLAEDFPYVKWSGYFWILRNRTLKRLAIIQLAQRNELRFWRSRDFLEIIFTDPSNGYGSLNSDLEPLQRTNQLGDTARRLILEGSKFGIQASIAPLSLSEATFLLSLFTRFPSKKLLSLLESERHQIRDSQSNYLVTNSWSRLFSKNRVMWPPSAQLQRSFFVVDFLIFKLLVLVKELIERSINSFNRVRNLLFKKI